MAVFSWLLLARLCGSSGGVCAPDQDQDPVKFSAVLPSLVHISVEVGAFLGACLVQFLGAVHVHRSFAFRVKIRPGTVLNSILVQFLVLLGFSLVLVSATTYTALFSSLPRAGRLRLATSGKFLR